MRARTTTPTSSRSRIQAPVRTWSSCVHQIRHALQPPRGLNQANPGISNRHKRGLESALTPFLFNTNHVSNRHRFRGLDSRISRVILLVCFISAALFVAASPQLLAQQSMKNEASAPTAAVQPVAIQVNASRQLGPLPPIWAYFGYDEPNYTYFPHGKELISELVALSPVTVHFRAHNLLTTGDGVPSLKWGSTNAYTEDAAGNPIYDWKIVDKILSTYLDAGAKPFVEIGFMPEALSVHPEPYKHDWPEGDLYTGWSYPPKDYAKWGELVGQLVKHCIERYGENEVLSWKFEIWNEPDIGYWHGTPEEYDKLYDFSAVAIKKVNPAVKVGGPATTSPFYPRPAEFLRQFLEHCAHGKNFATGETGAPLDFITFHAKGSPKFIDGHVEMGIRTNLASVDRGLSILAGFPQYAKLPVIISESDPDGCAACAATKSPQYAYRNGTLYPAFTATVLHGTLDLAAKYHADVQGMLTWAFEFEDKPYFEGYRTLATNGIDKPELNLFRMAGLMRGERISAESSGAIPVDAIARSGVRASPDVDVLAARSTNSITVLLWNYHDDDVAASDAPVTITLAGLSGVGDPVLLHHYRIDRDHCNAYTAWLAMGSPQSPTPQQYAALQAAGQLQLLASPRWLHTGLDGTLSLPLSLPRQSISLLEFTW
jgi:xylan 1,4-beta-xylosidase